MADWLALGETLLATKREGCGWCCDYLGYGYLALEWVKMVGMAGDRHSKVGEDVEEGGKGFDDHIPLGWLLSYVFLWGAHREYKGGSRWLWARNHVTRLVGGFF